MAAVSSNAMWALRFSSATRNVSQAFFLEKEPLSEQQHSGKIAAIATTVSKTVREIRYGLMSQIYNIIFIPVKESEFNLQ